MINIQELRKKGADQAFREYKFPEGCIVKDTGDWDVQHNEWKREVTTNEYVCGFIVRFKPGSSIITEAYGTMFPRGTRPANLLMFANMTGGEIHGNSVWVRGHSYDGYIHNFEVSDTTAQVEFRDIPINIMKKIIEVWIAEVKVTEEQRRS